MLDEAKFDALVHYVCASCDDPAMLGATKLNKILWYCDTGAFLFLGKSMTGAKYVKRQFGPVPKEVLAARQRLVQRGAIIERDAPLYGYSQRQLIALTKPDLSRFSAAEISLVDHVIQAVCQNHTAASISQLTHDHVWEAAEIGEELPLSSVFASQRGEIDEDDLAWGRAEMIRLEPIRAGS
jgi:hypothetical protein